MDVGEEVESVPVGIDDHAHVQDFNQKGTFCALDPGEWDAFKLRHVELPFLVVEVGQTTRLVVLFIQLVAYVFFRGLAHQQVVDALTEVVQVSGFGNL